MHLAQSRKSQQQKDKIAQSIDAIKLFLLTILNSFQFETLLAFTE